MDFVYKQYRLYESNWENRHSHSGDSIDITTASDCVANLSRAGPAAPIFSWIQVLGSDV